MSSFLRLLVLASVAGCLPEPKSFVVGDAGTDGGPVDAGPEDQGADQGPPDQGPTDAGVDAFVRPVTRVDLPCAVSWETLPADPGGNCAGRTVVDLADAVQPHDVAIAGTPAGDVLMAWNTNEFADQGDLVLRRESAEGALLATETFEGFLGEVVGYRVELAAHREVAHVAWWVRSDDSEIRHTRWLAEGGVEASVAIAADVGRTGALALALDGADAWIGYHDIGTGRHRTRTRYGIGGLSPVQPVEDDLDGRLPFYGAMTLASDDGVVQAAWARVRDFNAAVPRLGVWSGDWSGTTTLDNPGGTRLSGVGIDMVIADGVPVVAYLDWAGGDAEVRLARKTAGGDVTVDVRIPSFSLPDQPVDFPLALAVDGLGLLHLAVVVPSGAGASQLEYHRQTVPDGQWVMDVISTDLTSESAENQIDLFVTEDRQPHFLYNRAARIHHATIEL